MQNSTLREVVLRQVSLWRANSGAEQQLYGLPNNKGAEDAT